MMSLCMWFVLAFSAMHSTVRCQVSLEISSNSKNNGSPQPFNISCSYTSVLFESEKLDEYTDNEMQITHSRPLPNGTSSTRVLWVYSSEKQQNPNEPGRNWDAFVKEVFVNSSRTYHKALRLLVNDARCEDTGKYFCWIKIYRSAISAPRYGDTKPLNFTGCK